MKILVIDDKQVNLDSAIAQLGKEHELITASSYDEAERYLAGHIPHITDFMTGRWSKAGYPNEKISKYSFDVILTDLFLPTSKCGIDSEKATGDMPYGLVIALTAQRLGIPVAIVSDTNHHSHPILWAMDMINTGESYGVGPNEMKGKYEFRDEFYTFGKGKEWKLALDILLS